LPLLHRPRPPFAGGAYSAPDEATVRERVRGLIDDGILPRFNSGLLTAGPCHVARDCIVCASGIRPVRSR
jgi:hypothetical protein